MYTAWGRQRAALRHWHTHSHREKEKREHTVQPFNAHLVFSPRVLGAMQVTRISLIVDFTLRRKSFVIFFLLSLWLTFRSPRGDCTGQMETQLGQSVLLRSGFQPHCSATTICSFPLCVCVCANDEFWLGVVNIRWDFPPLPALAHSPLRAHTHTHTLMQTHSVSARAGLGVGPRRHKLLEFNSCMVEKGERKEENVKTPEKTENWIRQRKAAVTRPSALSSSVFVRAFCFLFSFLIH